MSLVDKFQSAELLVLVPSRVNHCSFVGLNPLRLFFFLGINRLVLVWSHLVVNWFHDRAVNPGHDGFVEDWPAQSNQRLHLGIVEKLLEPEIGHRTKLRFNGCTFDDVSGDLCGSAHTTSTSS